MASVFNSSSILGGVIITLPAVGTQLIARWLKHLERCNMWVRVIDSSPYFLFFFFFLTVFFFFVVCV